MKDGKNTYAVHHYYKSWLPVSTRIKTSIKKINGIYYWWEKI